MTSTSEMYFYEIEEVADLLDLQMQAEENLCRLIEVEGHPFTNGWWQLLGRTVREHLLKGEEDQFILPFPIGDGCLIDVRIGQSPSGWGVYLSMAKSQTISKNDNQITSRC